MEKQKHYVKKEIPAYGGFLDSHFFQNILGMKFFKGPVFFSILAVAILFGLYYPRYSSQQKEAVLINTILSGLSRMHYQPVNVDDDFSKKLYKLYIDRIDGSRRFLTQEDLSKLKTFENQLDDQATAGTYEFFNLTLDVLDRSLDKTQTYYREFLAKPFDFKKDETIETDGEKKDFAKNDAELKEYWRKSMKYETLTRLAEKLEAQKEGKDEDLKGKTLEELEADARKETLKVYDDYYVRLRKLKRSDRMSDYLNTVTNLFDPHTGYYEPIDRQNFDISMSGKLEGIGARLQTDGDHTKVFEIVVGGPAWKGKELQENDVVLKVAQEGKEPVDITGMQINDVVSMIRGPKGTKVHLTVKKVDGSVSTITIERDIVILEEGFAKSLLLNSDKGDKIGYINLPRFYADFEDASGRFCSVDVEQEIQKLKKENVQGIILDLRNNGGGSLRDVVKMTGFFIEEGPIVQVKSRGRQAEVLEDDDSQVQYGGPLIVMVNEFSASASEILAAALQDYGRAIIVGSNSTFGKGTVQRFYDLDRAIMGNDEVKPLGSIKLTTQKFYRVNGGSTQLKGVTPDIVFPDSYQYFDTGEKENDYPMAWSEIDPVTFAQNVAKMPNINQIISNSNNRVKGSELFQKVQENALRLKKQRDNSVFPLSLEAYTSWSEKLEKESAEYKELFQPIEQMAAANLPADLAAINVDESKKARNDEWLKSIKKDGYLYETLNIMHDLIKNEVADAQKK